MKQWLVLDRLRVPGMTWIRSSLRTETHHSDSICSTINSVPRAWQTNDRVRESYIPSVRSDEKDVESEPLHLANAERIEHTDIDVHAHKPSELLRVFCCKLARFLGLAY